MMGKACKSHQRWLDKKNSFSILVAKKSVNSCFTYILKYQKQMRANQKLGRLVRVINVGLTKTSNSPAWIH